VGDVRSLAARLRGHRASRRWSKHARLQLPEGRVALVDETTMAFLTSRAPAPAQASLDRALTGMTRIRVSSAVKGGPRLDVKAAATLVELAACLRITAPAERFRCICAGGQQVEI
jgi:hypothetical protein